MKASEGNDGNEAIESLSFEELKEAHRLADMTVRLEGDSFVTATGCVLYTVKFYVDSGGWYIEEHFPPDFMGCTMQFVGAREGYNDREEVLDVVRDALKKSSNFVFCE